MPAFVENSGSTSRDYLMLERNLLSHVKLAMLLSLLSSSVILKARLSNDPDATVGDPTQIQVPIASIEFGAALCAIGAGVFQYYSYSKDIRDMRGFLVSSKTHFAIMVVVAATVFTTCVVLLAEE
ncbi:uncharacterized protein FIBRA_00604 [Fibroporia radiculosa]|uniref:DUF202 domain-containing protein n=1 Tax=Fibroporia radiculosa TaxID=599839 RepID=J4HRV8_9APHY|nr:uncharacterized protein FIBRA_00604 [Fibroporia radiculosa]CCL98602.1 predicted protein [Fibroporia radiculosa]